MRRLRQPSSPSRTWRWPGSEPRLFPDPSGAGSIRCPPPLTSHHPFPSMENTTSAHTPGPWHVERESETSTGWKGISIVSKDRRNVASIVIQLDDNEAGNAHLIAAAPE